MLIYTIMPYSAVFPAEYNDIEKTTIHSNYLETDAQGQILRIYSTALSMYTKFSPGDIYKSD